MTHIESINNGNMTADLDRKIVTVRYNLLNLPDTIQYYDGSMTVNHYLADGTRLSSVHHTVLDGVVVPVGSVCNVDTIANVTTSGSAYCQNIEYEMQADGTPAISRVFNSEGFIAGILPTAQAAYYCRDAQGNITSVWRVDAGYPYQTTNYYADGHIKNNSTGTSFQPYLYSGKELQRMHGYDCYDYGARHSQTTLGRFTTPDPLAERYYDTSPYALCGGNPISRIDYNGMDWYSVNNEDGTQSGKWFNSSEPTVSDGGQTYNHVGKTMSGFNADGSFVYGAQDGQLYNSASLNEVTVNADQSALMTRSIHSAQNEFLSSDYTRMAVGLMGGMMAGPAALEYGYNAAVWAVPYVKSAAVASYNAGRQAYTVSSNAAKYYGSTAILNSVKWYGKVRTRAEIGYMAIDNSWKLAFLSGFADGFIKYKYDFPPDSPYMFGNPFFQISSDFITMLSNLFNK